MKTFFSVFFAIIAAALVLGGSYLLVSHEAQKNAHREEFNAKLTIRLTELQTAADLYTLGTPAERERIKPDIAILRQQLRLTLIRDGKLLDRAPKREAERILAAMDQLFP